MEVIAAGRDVQLSRRLASLQGSLAEGRGRSNRSGFGALGFAIATLARSQLAGIGAGIAFYFGETFARIFLPDVVQYLPFSVANAALATSSSGGGIGRLGGGATALSTDQALVLVAVWLVGALAVAALFSDRAEISG